MRPFVVDPAMHLRHSVSQPDFKVSAARDAEVFSDHSGKNYVEFLPTIPISNSPTHNMPNISAMPTQLASRQFSPSQISGPTQLSNQITMPYQFAGAKMTVASEMPNLSSQMPSLPSQMPSLPSQMPSLPTLPSQLPSQLPTFTSQLQSQLQSQLPVPTHISVPPSTQSKNHFLNFRPREAKNMPLAEKVSAWLNNVPWIQIGGDWVSNCYPGHVSTSSGSSNANLVDLKSSPTDQDIFEQQARQITRIITGNYLNNGETTARPITTVLDFSDQRYSDDGYLFDYAHVDMENP